MSTPEPMTRELLPPAETPATPGTELSLPERALAAMKLQVTAKQLTELAARTADITAITNADGRAQAHAAAMVLREQRIVIEKAGKLARDDANKFAKQVIVEASNLVRLIGPEEERLIGLRDAWDARIEAEKQVKAEAEAERKRTLQACLQAMRDVVAECAGRTASEIDSAIREFTGIVVTSENYGEFVETAKQVHANVLARLRSMHASALQVEQQRAEAEEKAKQRQAELEAEMAKQRQEKALNQKRLKAIADIQQQTVVASIGKVGRKPGTRECIVETLAETEAMALTEEEFGDLLPNAIASRDAAVQQIRGQLERWDERERQHKQAAIERDIDACIRSIPASVFGRSASDIEYTIDEVEHIEITIERFGEFTVRAQVAKGESLARLREMYAAQLASEREQDRQREEQRKLDEQRQADQAEQKRIADENAARAQELADRQAKLDRDCQQVELLQASLAAQSAPAPQPEPTAVLEPEPRTTVDLPIAPVGGEVPCKLCTTPTRALHTLLCDGCYDLSKHITVATAVSAITLGCEALGIADRAVSMLKVARKAQALLQAQAGAA